MTNHWLFWTAWISINAFASFFWGNLIVDSSFVTIAGMCMGITLFILAYGLLDGHLIKTGRISLSKSLRKGVYIKAGLQLLNFALWLDIIISPEIGTGLMSLYITQEIFGLSMHPQSFLFTFINTILTGAMLSVLVAIITFIIFLINKPRHAIDDKL